MVFIIMDMATNRTGLKVFVSILFFELSKDYERREIFELTPHKFGEELFVIH